MSKIRIKTEEPIQVKSFNGGLDWLEHGYTGDQVYGFSVISMVLGLGLLFSTMDKNINAPYYPLNLTQAV